MKSNKLFNVAGTKERLFEMMQKVNKVKLNEDFMNNPEMQNSTDTGILENAFNLLKTNQLKIKQSNTQTSGANTYLELIGTTAQGIDMVFRFKIGTSEGDQDGVINVNQAELSSLISTDVNIPEGAIALQQFNAQHKAEIIDAVSEYANINANEPELDEEYFKAVEKIESYPFTSKPRTMVTPAQYFDQKPTNPALRVKAPELNKFAISEDNVVTNNPFTANLGQHYYDKSSNSTKVKAIEDAIKFYQEQGIDQNSMPPDKYKKMVRHTANLMFTNQIAGMNEAKKKKRESGEYPDQIGSHFKPKSDYPVEKKKPTKVVQIDELDNMKEFSEVVMPNDDSKRGMKNPLLKNYFDKKQHQQMHEGDEPTEPEEKEIDSLEHEREEQGEKLVGGKGDEATPQEFDQEQVLNNFNMNYFNAENKYE